MNLEPEIIETGIFSSKVIVPARWSHAQIIEFANRIPSHTTCEWDIEEAEPCSENPELVQVTLVS
jgi:hypothetical protein